MYLKIIDINDIETEINVTIENVAEDLLMITINCNHSNKNVIPSYWRLTDVCGIPPLEIGINKESGELENITFYAERRQFKHYNLCDSATINGKVIVETSIFKKTNDYVDLHQGYYISLHKDCLSCVFDNTDTDHIQGVQNNRLKLYTNERNEIIEFSIYNLSSKDIEKIDSL